MTITDDAMIRRTVADAERHQNDVEPFVALHTPDMIVVNLAGRRVMGRDAFARAMTQALEGPLAKVLTTTQVDDIRYVRPDVAIVSCTKFVHDERQDAGQEASDASLPASGALTYVMVKESDAWRIASAQTTPIRS